MKKLSLLALLTVLIGSALFVTSCGGKIQADTVWQLTKSAGLSVEASKQYVCFGADGKMIGATNATGTLVKVPALSGDYTAKGGKIKAPMIAGGVEADYKISGETMKITYDNKELYELKKVTSPTAKEMKEAKTISLP